MMVRQLLEPQYMIEAHRQDDQAIHFLLLGQEIAKGMPYSQLAQLRFHLDFPSRGDAENEAVVGIAAEIKNRG